MVPYEKEENGIKIFSQITSDLAACLPLKKRKIFFKCPLSPLPSFASDNCDIQSNEAHLAAESSFSEVSDHMPDFSCAVFRDPTFERKVEFFPDREVNPITSYRNSPSSNGELSTEFENVREQTYENKSAFQSTLGPILEKYEPKSSVGVGSGGNTSTLTDEFTFQKDVGKVEFPSQLNKKCEGYLVKQNASSSSVKQKNLDSSALEITLSEQQYISQSQQTDSELRSMSENQYSRRFHWDLNTTMDVWEEPTDDEPLIHGAGGIDELDFRYLHEKRIETNPLQMTHQEASEFSLTLRESQLLESCSLKLSNTLKFPSKQCDANIDLNQQPNPTFECIVQSDSCTTHANTVVSSHMTSDLSLSFSPTSLAQVLHASVYNAVKTEPVEEDNGEGTRNMGVHNFMAVDRSIVKLETLDGAKLEGFMPKCLNAMRSTCGDAVKSGEAIVSRLKYVGGLEGKAHQPELYAKSEGTVDIREMHQDAKESASGSLDLLNQGLIVSFSKEYSNTETANVVPSNITEKNLSKMSTLVSGLLVHGHNEPDFGRSAPYNAISSHGTHDSSRNRVRGDSISNINNSQNFVLVPICVDIPQNAGENTTKASGMDSKCPMLLGNECSQVREVTNAELDGKGQTFTSARPRIGEESSYQRLSQSVFMDIPNVDLSTGKKTTNTALKGEVEKLESFEPECEPTTFLTAIGINETVVTQPSDDGDPEDVKVRELQLQSAVNTYNATPDKNIGIVAVKFDHAVIIPSDLPVRTPSTVAGTESNFENPNELKDVLCTVECNSLLCTERNERNNAHFYLSKDAEGESTGVPTIESGKNEVISSSHKLPQEPSDTKAICSDIFCYTYLDGEKNENGVIDEQAKGRRISRLLAAYHSGLYGKSASHIHGVTKYVRRGRSYIRHLTSSSTASSAGRNKSVHRGSSSSNRSTGRNKSTHRRSSSWSGREKIKYKSSNGGNANVNTSRFGRCIDQVYKSGKERKLDQPRRKPRSYSQHLQESYSRTQGWDSQQLDTLHASWDPCHEHGSELRMSDSYEDALRNLHHSPIRRSSPGRRAGPETVDVQVIRGTRDIGQDGRVEGSISKTCVPMFEEKSRNDFAYDMADSYLPPGVHATYGRGNNCSIQSERSFSPVKRRDAPHSLQISLSSSPATRTQARQLLSPSRRSPNHFGHTDLPCCRSPPVLSIERTRSPWGHNCFPHDEMKDFGTLREHSFSRTNLPSEGNVRGIDSIGHQANKQYARHLRSGQLCGLKYGACADEGYGRALSFRQGYSVGDSDKNTVSFHHHAQGIHPRPIILYQDKDEEIAGRGSPGDVCVRNKWRNVHRRMRLMGGRG